MTLIRTRISTAKLKQLQSVTKTSKYPKLFGAKAKGNRSVHASSIPPTTRRPAVASPHTPSPASVSRMLVVTPSSKSSSPRFSFKLYTSSTDEYGRVKSSTYFIPRPAPPTPFCDSFPVATKIGCDQCKAADDKKAQYIAVLVRMKKEIEELRREQKLLMQEKCEALTQEAAWMEEIQALQATIQDAKQAVADIETARFVQVQPSRSERYVESAFVDDACETSMTRMAEHAARRRQRRLSSMSSFDTYTSFPTCTSFSDAWNDAVEIREVDVTAVGSSGTGLTYKR